MRAGELGRILSVEAQMNCSHPAEVRQWLQDFPGGMMFFLGCHLVDLILQLKGMPDNIIPLNRCTGMDGVTAQDFGMAVFEYPDGISFAKTSACEKGGFLRGRRWRPAVHRQERKLRDRLACSGPHCPQRAV